MGQVVAQRVLAASGQAAPGTEAGTVFGGLGVPGIGARGDVAFNVTLSGPGVTSNSQSSLWLVPGGAGSAVLGYRGTDATNQYTGYPSVGVDGRIAFMARVGPSLGVISGSPGNYRTVFKTGDPAPGMPAGVTLQPETFVYGNRPVLDRAGTVYFESMTNYGPFGGQLGAFISTGEGPPQLVTYAGAPAPGVADVTITDFSHAGLGGGGHVAFAALTRSSQNVSSRGVWTGTVGNLTRIAYTGMPAPGLPSDRRMNLFRMGPGVNSSGATAFTVDPVTSGGVYYPPVAYLYDHGQLTLMGGLGTPVPALGEGYTLTYATTRRITDRGEALLRVSTRGPTGSEVAGWDRWRGGVVTPIVQDGMAAPSLGVGVTLTKTSVISFNEAGQALLTATLVGPGVDSTNRDSLWAVDPLGQFSLVARTGTGVSVGGVERIVGSISASQTLYETNGFNDLLVPASLSDSGQAAYQVTFVDGSSANLLATLPSVIAGDVNNDLVVDLKDFDVLYRHLGQAGDRAVGDLDYDGVVSFTDYQVFQRNFGRSIDGGAVQAVPEDVAALVPEPGGAVVVLGAVVLGARRRRRQARRFRSLKRALRVARF